MAEMLAVRIPLGWRTFFVYDADGTLVHTGGGYHEEAARRDAARIHGLNHEALTAELKERTPA